MTETGGGGSTCMQELEKPPSKSHMGPIQIIELVLMAVVGVLCIVDFISQLRVFSINFWGVLAIICDVLFIAGLVYIIIGLFCNFTSKKIKIGIYCFFGAIVIQLVFIIGSLATTRRLIDWLMNLVKALVMVFLCWILWKQSNNVEG